MRTLIGSSLALLVAGCIAAEHVAPLPDRPLRCTPGAAFCDGNTAYLCNDQGYAVDGTGCGESAVCVSGSCQGNIVCTPNQRLCVRNVLRVCNGLGTELTTERVCGSDICQNGQCVDPGQNACLPTARYCDGNTALQCNADGSAPIDGGQPCGPAICVDGSCLPIVCQAATADCDGNTARTCDALGTSYSVRQLCSGNERCVAGRCQVLVCTPGRSCVGNLLTDCNEQGTQIIDQRDCAPLQCLVQSCVGLDAGHGDAERLDHALSDLDRPEVSGLDRSNPDRDGLDRRGADRTALDVALPDRVQPDVNGPTCSSDLQCPGGYCHPNLHRCLGLPANSCSSHDQCPGVVIPDFCDPLTRTCIPACYQEILCLGLFDATRINCIDGGCYQCHVDGDCPGTACDLFDWLCKPCADNSGCLDPGWHCDSTTGACHECLDSTHCASNQVCFVDEHRCVECNENNDCHDGSRPLCGKSHSCLPPCSDECSQNQIRCDPTDLTPPISMLQCEDNDDDPCLDWSTLSTSCGWHQTCQYDRCVCTNGCASGYVACDTIEPGLLHECVQDYNNCWYISDSYCDAIQDCRGGACICAFNCTAGTRRCVNGHATQYEICTLDSYVECNYWSINTCPANTGCQGTGVCR